MVRRWVWPSAELFFLFIMGVVLAIALAAFIGSQAPAERERDWSRGTMIPSAHKGAEAPERRVR